MKTAVIYARVSTDEQARGYSLKAQVEAGRKYATKRGYTVARDFVDDYTGASLDRPALNQLREFVAAEQVDVVIVYDVDRLARKSVYQMIIEEELSRLGAVVEYVLGQYPDTDEGRLQRQIRGSIAEYEKAKILERSKRGKRGKAQSGFVLVGARPPYGYRVRSEPHKSWLEVDDEEARIVRLVFSWYLNAESGQRLSIRAIARRLGDMSVPTRGDRHEHVAKKNGQGVWTSAMIRHILTNETYTGVWHYGKTRMVKDGREATRKSHAKRGLGKQVAQPREQWVAVPVPAIISQREFELVQARLKENKQLINGRRTRKSFLLSKRLKCAKCGYGMHCNCVYGRHFYYVCNGRYQVEPVCDLPSFRADLVDDAVWQWVKGFLQHPEQITAGLRAEQARADLEHQALQERLVVIEKQLAEAQNQLRVLLDLYLQGGFAQDVLAERKARLEKNAADLAREHMDLTALLQAASISSESIAAIEAFCAEVRDGLEEATLEDKLTWFELLDVRGRLAIENDEKVVYAICRVGQQRLVQVQTSPLSSTGATRMTGCACPPTARCP